MTHCIGTLLNTRGPSWKGSPWISFKFLPLYTHFMRIFPYIHLYGDLGTLSHVFLYFINKIAACNFKDASTRLLSTSSETASRVPSSPWPWLTAWGLSWIQEDLLEKGPHEFHSSFPTLRRCFDTTFINRFWNSLEGLQVPMTMTHFLQSAVCHSVTHILMEVWRLLSCGQDKIEWNRMNFYSNYQRGMSGLQECLCRWERWYSV